MCLGDAVRVRGLVFFTGSKFNLIARRSTPQRVEATFDYLLARDESRGKESSLDFLRSELVLPRAHKFVPAIRRALSYSAVEQALLRFSTGESPKLRGG